MTNIIQFHSPLVSIGMPVFNGEKYIEKAINSLLNQNYSFFELIISDNASTDSTCNIISKFAQKDDRIKLYKQQKNLGAAENYRFVVRQARGKYFFWAACDDWWDEAFISTLVSGLESNNRYGLAMSSIAIMEQNVIKREIIFEGKDNLSTMENIDLIKRMGRLEKKFEIHNCIYGIFITELLKKLVNRPFPECKASDRIFMCEVSLSTLFFSTSNVFFFKNSKNEKVENVIKRYEREGISSHWTKNDRTSRYLYAMFKQIIFSKVVNMKKKILFLSIWIQIVNSYRNGIRGEMENVKIVKKILIFPLYLISKILTLPQVERKYK